MPTPSPTVDVPRPDWLQDIPGDQLEAARKYYTDDEIRNYLQSNTIGGKFEDPNTASAGAPASERAAASFKSGGADRKAYWESKYPGQISISPAGEILIKGKSPNKPGFDWGDIASFGGDIPELLGVIAGGATGGVGGAAAGAAGGNVVKQAIGAMLPGDSTRGIGERVGETAKAGIGGAIGQFVGGKLSGPNVGSMTSPVETYLVNRTAKVGGTAEALEGKMLREKTGFPLNLAEETNDPWMKMILGFAYRNAYGQEMAALDQKAKDSAALSMLKRLSGKLGQLGGFENADFATAATNAARASVKDIEDSLARVSKEDYGFLKTPLGEQASIIPTRRNKLLNETADYYESMGTPQGLAAAKELRGMMAMPGRTFNPALSKVSPEPGAVQPLLTTHLNPRAVQDLMREYGDEAFGSQTAKLYKELSTASGKRLDRELWGAMKDDLTAAARQGDLGAQQLLRARGRTSELLTLRERLKDVPLIKFMESKGLLKDAMTQDGLAGMENIGPMILKGMMALPGKAGHISPMEISNMMKLVSATNPNFAHDFMRMIVDNAVRAGKDAGAKGIRPARFSYEDAAKQLPSPRHLQAIYQDVWNPGTRASGMEISSDLSLLLKAIQRAHTVGQGIPHAPGQTALSIGGNLVQGNMLAALKQYLGQIAFTQKAAKYATDPTFRENLMAKLGGKELPREPGFMEKYVDKALPALLYESGSKTQRENRQDLGR